MVTKMRNRQAGAEPGANVAPPRAAAPLRAEAEAAFAQAVPADLATADNASLLEARRLVHELQVHQIELELQNDELLRIQGELDNERDRFFELYDLAPVAYLTLDENGQIARANQACATLLGVPRSGLIAQPLSRFVHPADADTFHLLRRALGQDPAQQTCELRLRRGATLVWVTLVAAAAQSGEPSARRVVLSDITAQKRVAQALNDRMAMTSRYVAADQALRESEARFRALTELSADWYWESDTEGRYTAISSFNAATLPFDRTLFLGRNNSEIEAQFGIRREQLTPSAQELAALLARHAVCRDATSMVHLPDGREFILRYSMAPRFDANGRYCGYRGLTRDVTQATHDATALELAHRRLALAISASRTLLLDVDLVTGEITIHGSPGRTEPAEPRVRSVAQTLALAHPDDVERLRGVYDDARRGVVEDLDIEFRSARRDGQWSWRYLHARAIDHDPQTRRPLRLVCATVDIDSRKRAELALVELNRELEARIASRTDALAESEDRLRAMMEGAPVGILVVAPDGGILEANPRACEILGYPEAMLLTLDAKAITHPDDWSANADLAARMSAGEVTGFALEKRYVRPDGQIVWAHLTVAGVNDAQGQHRYRISVIEDITERRLAQEREQHYAAQVSALSGRLLHAQEDERRHLARELHDEIGQVLTSFQMALGAVEQGASKARRAHLLTSARQVVSDAITRVRQLWLRLRPPVLDDLGLEAALHGLCRQQEGLTSMQVEFSAAMRGVTLQPVAAQAIYRICQEALNNAARHARANAVQVQLLAQEDGWVVLTVRDNGAGFDPAQTVSNEQLGIVGMRERAKVLGGTLRVESGPTGTLVRAAFERAAAIAGAAL